MMGVNLGAAASGESLSPSVYPQIVKSVSFCQEVMAMPIPIEKASRKISLYDYYTNKEYQPKSILGGIKKYTIGLPGVILSSVRGKKTPAATNTVYSDSITGKVITLTEDERKRTRKNAREFHQFITRVEQVLQVLNDRQPRTDVGVIKEFTP